uniref:Homeobox domain-containing protein n=1 Tax=Nelumbo nucifera TaxID=4432 RepID=A0A822YZN4_NELNU|nr:TPA_asm: hypothetical protein HUJ06_013877 [Nelumbo nucifera]
MKEENHWHISSNEKGEQKVKRKMKTSSQLELLEKTYAEKQSGGRAAELNPPFLEQQPSSNESESLRAELSAKLGLTDRQLQMWFCQRRLKDRKVAPVK